MFKLSCFSDLRLTRVYVFSIYNRRILLPVGVQVRSGERAELQMMTGGLWLTSPEPLGVKLDYHHQIKSKQKTC